VARAIIITAKPERRDAYEPLFDIDSRTGASIELVHVDRTLAVSFGARSAGRFHWSCQVGCLLEDQLIGPFGNSFVAYRGNASAHLEPTPQTTIVGRQANGFRPIRLGHLLGRAVGYYKTICKISCL
jgi:hypothetical protein